jgi:eukaryotic-like serine/threonine-protein kinase
VNGRLAMACLAAAAITGLAPVVASSATASATTGTVNWPGFHDNAADTGYNPSETTLGPGNVAGLSQQWLASTDGAYTDSAPTIAGGSLFTDTFKTEEEGFLQAFNASTGAPEWTSDVPAAASDPAYGDGQLFVASGVNGGVYAYNAATGALDWSLIQSSDGDGSEPVFANGLVYVAGYGTISALNPATGAQVWSEGSGGLVRSVPAVSDGRLFIAIEPFAARYPQNLIVLNASTGALLWRKKLGTGIQQASPVVTSDMVYQCSGSTLYAVWAKTGDLRWSEPSVCDIDNTPALANGVLYTAEDQSDDVYAINASTGAVEWNVAGTGSDNAAPAVANGVVYVPMAAGTVAAYDASTGALLWTSPDLGFLNEPGAAEPAVVNGLLYVGGADGLYAFGLGG